jgi:hypothetical protein
MPFDNRHAPLDSPHLTGEGTSTVPGINEDNNRIATMRNLQALARRPPPTNAPIQLLGDVQGRGTIAIDSTVTGFMGLPLTRDIPADTEVYVWSQAAHAWELVPACQLGQQSDGNDLVQVSDGAGGFTGVINHVMPGSYPAANVTVDRHGLILSISTGVLDASIADAPSDGHAYGRLNATWAIVATESFVTSRGYLLGNQTITLSGDVTGSGTTGIPARVEGIQGRHVTNAAPLDGQVLRWNSAANELQWATVTTGPPPTTGSIWDGGASIWDGGASIWDGIVATIAIWDLGASIWDGGLSAWVG